MASARLYTTLTASGLALVLSACGAPATNEVPANTPSPFPALNTYDAATLAATCSGCHAPANTAMIDLSTYTEEAMNTRLLAYKTEEGGTVMHRIARGYEDDELTAIAAYLTETTK